jgi:hypothetical protein
MKFLLALLIVLTPIPSSLAGQCVAHAPVAPGIVFVSITYHFTFDLKDANAVSWSEQSLMNSLWSTQPGRYQLASTKPTPPALMVSVTVSNTNGQAPYSAVLAIQTNDGGSLVDNLSSEPTPSDMTSALAQRINMYVILGWGCK